MVSIMTTQLCCCSPKAAIDNTSQMLTLILGHVPSDVPTLGPNGGPQEAVRGMGLSVRERSRINREPRIIRV